MTFGTLILLLCFVLPFEGPRKHLPMLLSTYFVALLFFIITSCKDPGHVKKSEKISFLKLNKYFDPSFICPTCEIVAPKESRHCYICNKCVDRFDHHCQWVNSCIGIGNHSVFYVFLISMWAYLVMVDYVCFANIDLIITHNVVVEAINSHIVNSFFRNIHNGTFESNPIKWLFPAGLIDEFSVQVWYDTILLITISAASFFLVPLTILVII